MPTPVPVPAPSRALPALSNGAWAALAVIVLVAAWLRFWTIGAGLPYALGVDEPEIVTRVVAMMKTGDFNPRFFDWPSLTFYVQLVVSCLVFLAGAMHGAWNSLAAVGPEDFYYSGRAVTATIGTGTVLVLFCAARRWSTATALLAAAILAILPTHVRESHFVLADVPTAFFTTLALLLAIRAWEGDGAEHGQGDRLGLDCPLRLLDDERGIRHMRGGARMEAVDLGLERVPLGGAVDQLDRTLAVLRATGRQPAGQCRSEDDAAGDLGVDVVLNHGGVEHSRCRRG